MARIIVTVNVINDSGSQVDASFQFNGPKLEKLTVNGANASERAIRSLATDYLLKGTANMYDGLKSFIMDLPIREKLKQDLQPFPQELSALLQSEKQYVEFEASMKNDGKLNWAENLEQSDSGSDQSNLSN